MGLFSKGDGGDSNLALIVRQREAEQRAAALRDAWRGRSRHYGDMAKRVAGAGVYDPIKYNRFTSRNPYGTGVYDPDTGEFTATIDDKWGVDRSLADADTLRARAMEDPFELQKKLYGQRAGYMDREFTRQEAERLSADTGAGRQGITSFVEGGGYDIPLSNAERLALAQQDSRERLFADIYDQALGAQRGWMDQSLGLGGYAQGVTNNAIDSLFGSATQGWSDAANASRDNRQRQMQQFYDETGALDAGAEADFMEIVDPANARYEGMNNAWNAWENQGSARRQDSIFSQILGNAVSSLFNYGTGKLFSGGGGLFSSGSSGGGGGTYFGLGRRT